MDNRNWIQFLTHPAINILVVLFIGLICTLLCGKIEHGPDQFGALAFLLMIIGITILILSVYFIAFWVFKKFY